MHGCNWLLPKAHVGVGDRAKRYIYGLAVVRLCGCAAMRLCGCAVVCCQRSDSGNCHAGYNGESPNLEYLGNDNPGSEVARGDADQPVLGGGGMGGHLKNSWCESGSDHAPMGGGGASHAFGGGQWRSQTTRCCPCSLSFCCANLRCLILYRFISVEAFASWF